MHRKHLPGPAFRWADVPIKAYKTEGSHFRGITRQVLFDELLPAQLRYFEIEPGGYSSFERHQHVHAVMVLHGQGRALVDHTIYEIAPFDLISVPPMTWHQFYAGDASPIGFLCLVDCVRDRPQRPDDTIKRAFMGHARLRHVIKF